MDCGYTSVYDEFKYVLHESFHLPAFPILTIANQLALNNYGFQLKNRFFRETITQKYVADIFYSRYR